jgi:hypothetical protein
MMFLRVGKQDHEDQGHYDTSGDEVLHHGCHSASLAHWVVATATMMMITKAAAVNAARAASPVDEAARPWMRWFRRSPDERSDIRDFAPASRSAHAGYLLPNVRQDRPFAFAPVTNSPTISRPAAFSYSD